MKHFYLKRSSQRRKRFHQNDWRTSNCAADSSHSHFPSLPAAPYCSCVPVLPLEFDLYVYLLAFGSNGDKTTSPVLTGHDGSYTTFCTDPQPLHDVPKRLECPWYLARSEVMPWGGGKAFQLQMFSFACNISHGAIDNNEAHDKNWEVGWMEGLGSDCCGSQLRRQKNALITLITALSFTALYIFAKTRNWTTKINASH